MRYLPVAFLVLLAAHGPLHRRMHHAMPSNWHMGARDGSLPSDFNRTFGHLDKVDAPHAPHRFDRIDIGNGAKLNVGFIGGRHMGLKLKLPF